MVWRPAEAGALWHEANPSLGAREAEAGAQGKAEQTCNTVCEPQNGHCCPSALPNSQQNLSNRKRKGREVWEM